MPVDYYYYCYYYYMQLHSKQYHTAPVSHMHAVPALSGMYALCMCGGTYIPHTAGIACMRETGAV